MTKTIKAMRVTAPYLVSIPGSDQQRWVWLTVEGAGGNHHEIIRGHGLSIGAHAWDFGQATKEWVHEIK